MMVAQVDPTLVTKNYGHLDFGHKISDKKFNISNDLGKKFRIKYHTLSRCILANNHSLMTNFEKILLVIWKF